MSRPGQEIVYCSTCSTQVRGQDFEKGKAFRVKDQVFCATCRPDLARENAGKPLSASRAVMPAAPSLSSSQFRRVSTPSPEGRFRIWGLGAAAAAILVLGSILLLRSSQTPTDLARPLAQVAGAPTSPEESLPPKPERAQFPAIRDPGENARLLEERLRRKAEDLRAGDLAGPVEATSKDAPPPAPTKDPDPKTPSGAAPPAPTAPGPAPEPLIRAEWGAALAPTRARDFGAALAALRKLPPSVPGASGDLEILGQVADLHREALQILSTIPKGQKLVLDVRKDSGETRRVEGSFLRAEAGRVVLKTESTFEEAELGEILPSSLAQAVAAGGKAPSLAASGLSCLLEGDLEAARKILGDQQAQIPERYWVYARQVSESQRRADPLRALYAQALKDLDAMETASRGVGTLQALLRDHAGDPFVIRNKASLVDRAQGARDYLLLAEELRAVGALRAAKGGRVETFWTSDGDPEAGKARENYLEAVFSTVPDAAYRCWILAGGCCLETFEFSCQGSEFLGAPQKGVREPATPGGPVSLLIKPYISSLKKSHSAHTGPKHAARWEWVPLPLPKYANPGPQSLRILFEQKGFSVAGICISASRSGPPSDIDLKEWIRSRAERPKVELLQAPKVIPILRCLFDGTDRRLVGTLDKGSLSGVLLYQKCFLGLERSEPVTLPPKGELRATYFLRSTTPLSFRLRIERGSDQSVPYDFVVEKPAVGVLTEIRIPFTQFKAINLPGTPAVAPGDLTRNIYVFGEAVDCGLSLNALSLVEIRAAESPRELRPTASERRPLADGVPVFSLDLEGGKKPTAVQTGIVVKAPERAGDRWCLFAEPQPTGVSPLFVDIGGPSSYRFDGDEVFAFDYWVDASVIQLCFNIADRTRGIQHQGSVDKPISGKWTHASFRMADLGEPQTRLRPGDLVAGLYMQALGGSTRKFFIDNLEVVKPRPSK
jgi:hypothetical protein